MHHSVATTTSAKRAAAVAIVDMTTTPTVLGAHTRQRGTSALPVEPVLRSEVRHTCDTKVFLWAEHTLKMD